MEIKKTGLRAILTSVVITAVVSSVWVVADAQQVKGVDYPAGYRSWQHIKSMIIQPAHPLADPFGGIHHIYGNAKAMKGLLGGRYENGAVFVFDLLDYDDSNETIVELSRKRIDVMQFDADLFSDTGGWGYDTFVADSATERLDQNVEAACYACHSGAEASNYVFSQYRP